MDHQQEINTYLSDLLTNAIHTGNESETEKLLKLIQDIQGTVTVELIENSNNL